MKKILLVLVLLFLSFEMYSQSLTHIKSEDYKTEVNQLDKMVDEYIDNGTIEIEDKEYYMQKVMNYWIIDDSISAEQQKWLNTIKAVDLFLSDRVLSFDEGFEKWSIPLNKGAFDRELNRIKKSNINYTHIIHFFYGHRIDPDLWMGISGHSRGGGIAKQFIKYTTYQKDGVTYIEVIYGNDDW